MIDLTMSCAILAASPRTPPPDVFESVGAACSVVVTVVGTYSVYVRLSQGLASAGDGLSAGGAGTVSSGLRDGKVGTGAVFSVEEAEPSSEAMADADADADAKSEPDAEAEADADAEGPASDELAEWW